MMRNNEDYVIHFVGLKLEEHQFEYEIDNTFFDDLGYNEFNSAKITCDVTLLKKNTHLEFDFRIEGVVNVECDISLEHFDLPLQNAISLVVKFGSDFKEIDDNLVVIPASEHKIDIQQYIYECVVLALPSKRIHPGVEDGSMQSEILNKLNHHSIDREEKKEIDPRWDKLKKLL